MKHWLFRASLFWRQPSPCLYSLEQADFLPSGNATSRADFVLFAFCDLALWYFLLLLVCLYSSETQTSVLSWGQFTILRCLLFRPRELTLPGHLWTMPHTKSTWSTIAQTWQDVLLECPEGVTVGILWWTCLHVGWENQPSYLSFKTLWNNDSMCEGCHHSTS
jgi:hypothetical protein